MQTASWWRIRARQVHEGGRLLSLGLALVTLLLTGWAATRAMTDPYDGLMFHPTGLVNGVDAQGPTSGLLEPGDILINIGGQPVLQVEALYAGKEAGDVVVVDFRRDHFPMETSFRLVSPPVAEIASRLAVLAVAFVFWAVGTGVILFRPIDPVAGLVTSFFFIISALGLAAGEFSQQGPPWMSGLFYLSFWLIGPLAFHFHLFFPQPVHLPGQRFFVISLYLFGLLGGLPYLIFGKNDLGTSVFFEESIYAGRLFIAFNLMAVLAMLMYSFLFTRSKGARSKVRLVALGGGVSACLFIGLTILPELLFQRVFLPFPVAALALAFLPLTYGYAIFRHQLIDIERQVNRGATIFLVLILLGLAYLLVYSILTTLIPSPWINEPILGALLVVLLAAAFTPLRRGMQRIVDTAFYGGWYDYRSAVTSITEGLAQITSLERLGETVIQRLVNTLRIEEASIYLRDIHGMFSVYTAATYNSWDGESSVLQNSLPIRSLSFLKDAGEVVEREAMRRSMVKLEVKPDDIRWLETEQVQLWVPVVNHNEVAGLLALGPKFGGDIFSAEDLDILRVIARQLGPIIENIHLVERLRDQTVELESRVALRTEELHQAKERVEAILAGVGDGVIVTDLNLVVCTVNAAFEQKTGFLQDEIVGYSFASILSAETAERSVRNIQECLVDGEIWRGELTGRRKDGSFYDIHVTFAPVRNQNNKIVSYVASQRDITQAKELERLKDRFVGDISHELRTPTGNISLYLELLETAHPDKRGKYIRVLREQSQLLIGLVEDILSLSRLTAKKPQDLVLEDCDFSALVRKVAQVYEPMAQAKGVEFSIDLPGGWLYIHGNSNYLERMVTNLIVNAVRYTPAGSIWVRVRGEDGRVVLEVGDTGVGIEQEDIPHLFDRFYRGKNVRQSQIHGTGLGLAIVKEIVDLHGGSIEVNSEAGNGAIFRVWLPVTYTR